MKPLDFNLIPSRPVSLPLKIGRKRKFKKTKLVNIYARSELKSSVKNRNEYNDYDYLDKLQPTDKKWLTKFHREWLNADFKSFSKPFHNTFKKRKRCNDMNNSRNRDIFSRKRATYQLKFLGDEVFDIIDEKNYFEGKDNE